MILEVGQTRSFPRPAFSEAEANPTSLFLNLPYELRQQILKFALIQPDTIELQHPLWAGLNVFAQPLFKVNRALREDALDAFYEVNDFLWVIDTSTEKRENARSDPANYPAPTTTIPSMKLNGGFVRPEIGSPLTPILPWEFPRLRKMLRRLQVNVYLPRQGRDTCALREKLRRLVEVLNRGSGLDAFHLLVTSKRRNGFESFWNVEACCAALEILAEMRVRGSVEVQTRYYPYEVWAAIWRLQLERRMKGR